MTTELLNYFNQDELAATVWKGKYAADGEKTPVDMHMRMAKEFARIRYKKDKSKTEKQLEEEFFNLFDRFKWIVPQGRVMSGLGVEDSYRSLSNCLRLPPPNDSYGSIMYTDTMLVNSAKRGCGYGLGISKLRPKGASVKNSANSSTGASSFMERYSNSTREVAQSGRRGACLIDIDVRHPDAQEFITIKNDKTKVTGANISVKLHDDFMKCIINDGTYLQRFPVDTEFTSEQQIEYNNKLNYDEMVFLDGVYIKKIKAKKLWDLIIDNAHSMAEPGLFFWNRMVDYDPASAYPQFQIDGTNACGEQPMAVFDTCRLILHNLYSYVKNPFTETAYFDYEKFYTNAYKMMQLGDDLVDLEIEYLNRIITKILSDDEPIKEKQIELDLWTNVRDMASDSRRVGCGITALGDMLAALGLRYDSDDALEVVQSIMRLKMKGELCASIDMAKSYGTFTGYDFEKEFPNGEGINSFYTFLKKEFPEEIELMKTHGRRNVNWSTIAPAGTVSIMTQTTSGCEPIFLPYYMRRKKINPADVNSRIDFVDQNGDSWQEFPVMHPKFVDFCISIGISQSKLMEMKEPDVKELFLKSPWFGSTANEIDWVKRVKMQSVLQKYTTSAISTTLNLPNSVHKDTVSTIYMESWENGLKGQTIYRDGCRTGVLVSNTEEKTDFKYHNAPKRPKQTKCNVHRLTALGEKWVVLVGLMEDRPYEIFAVPQTDFNISNSCETGIIMKKARGKYSFICNDEIIEDISLLMRNEDERSDTRMYSLALRHGVEPIYIIQQIEKSAGNITSFNKSIARTLKKYVDLSELAKQLKCTECGSNNLAMEEGCMKCMDCGNSKCG